MKNILLLGGTGYVGNILSTYLNNDFFLILKKLVREQMNLL